MDALYSSPFSPSRASTSSCAIMVGPSQFPPTGSSATDGRRATTYHRLRSIIVPLQSSLSLQLSVIARHYSFPSTSGLSLYLNIPALSTMDQCQDTQQLVEKTSHQPATSLPRITEDSWPILFRTAPLGQSHELLGQDSSEINLLAPTWFPIVAQLEFNLDLLEADWYENWRSALCEPHSSPDPRRATPSMASLSGSERSCAASSASTSNSSPDRLTGSSSCASPSPRSRGFSLTYSSKWRVRARSIYLLSQPRVYSRSSPMEPQVEEPAEMIPTILAPEVAMPSQDRASITASLGHGAVSNLSLVSDHSRSSSISEQPESETEESSCEATFESDDIAQDTLYKHVESLCDPGHLTILPHSLIDSTDEASDGLFYKAHNSNQLGLPFTKERSRQSWRETSVYIRSINDLGPESTHLDNEPSTRRHTMLDLTSRAWLHWLRSLHTPSSPNFPENPPEADEANFMVNMVSSPERPSAPAGKIDVDDDWHSCRSFVWVDRPGSHSRRSFVWVDRPGSIHWDSDGTDDGLIRSRKQVPNQSIDEQSDYDNGSESSNNPLVDEDYDDEGEVKCGTYHPIIQSAKRVQLKTVTWKHA